MTATTWNAGIAAKKANPTLTAGEAWDAWIDTEDAIRAMFNYSPQDLINAQMNFTHAFQAA